MKRWLLLLTLWMAPPAWATSIVPMTLDELLARTDHVLLATITAVDMVDGQGRPVTDPHARTGPGMPNRIRYHLRVDRTVVSDAAKAPATLLVPEWPMWHYTLGSVQESATGQQRVFFLRGPAFVPADSAQFAYPTDAPALQRLLGGEG